MPNKEAEISRKIADAFNSIGNKPLIALILAICFITIIFGLAMRKRR